MKKILLILSIFFYANLSASIETEFVKNAHTKYEEKKYKEAVDMYNRGCYMGFDDACISLGAMYLIGDYVKQNINKAKRYLAMSCIKGNISSCNLLEQEKQRQKDIIKARLQDADFFMRKNISFDKVKRWKEAGFTAKEIRHYINNNITLNEAKNLKD